MTKNRKIMLTLVVLAMLAAAAGVVVLFVLSTGTGHSTNTGSSSVTNTESLPSGCVKPANGYLIIADEEGFNDSKLHGAPSTPGPIINVTQGTTVTMVVCNADPTAAHGFQINHYYDSNIESVAPGQAITVSFVANEAGTFQIYCSILCPPHIFMQSGQLRVSAA